MSSSQLGRNIAKISIGLVEGGLLGVREYVL
jgi:hypothetical protein